VSVASLAAVARLDLSEVARSRWLAACLLLYGGLALVFVGVGLRESAVLGFTGMGRVLFSFCHALVLLLPLVALVVTGQVVNRSREDGGLEFLLSQPLSRTSYFGAITLVRYGALVLPLLALLLLLAIAGSGLAGLPVPWAFLARGAAVSAALLWAFVALGLATSVWVRSPTRAMTWIILFWAAAVALLDFGLISSMLRWRLPAQLVFALAALNPVGSARLALLSAAEPELATLGPVGFYLTHRVGSGTLLALGIGWPTLFGVTLWALALRSFRRGDGV
jgi:ABC-type transport system involved in multi-copper enzyme maturation permease subunit